MKEIRFSHVSKSFREGTGIHPVLSDVNVTVKTGSWVSLLGRSGSGKSTMLHLAAGLHTPDSGEVALGEVVVSNLSEQKRTLFRRKHIGFVFQFFNLVPTLTVLENVMLPLHLNGVEKKESRLRAEALLHQLGLQSRLDVFPSVLSGGEQQRIAVARAAAADPDIILADEPTGNLDEKSADSVLDLFSSLRKTGTTILMATHSMEAASCGDLIFRIKEGVLVPHGQVL